MRLVAAASVAVLLLACSQSLSVEQQVISTLRNMEAAAENGEVFEFMSYVDKTFSAQHSSMDRREFHRFMIFQINQHRRLQAQFLPIYVKQAGVDKASAYFRLLITGGGGLLPESGQLFEVETQWLKIDGDWLLESAQWEPVRLPDLPTGRNR